MNSHTPGPWYVGAQNDALYVIDRMPRPSNDDVNPDVDIEPIAKIYRPREGTPRAEEANARLIAAAPDLLGALTRLLGNALEEIEGVPLEAVEMARVAVAKATH